MFCIQLNVVFKEFLNDAERNNYQLLFVYDAVALLITLVWLSDKGALPTTETGWARLFQVIGNNYQNWIFMLLCIIATLFALFIGEILVVIFIYFEYISDGIMSAICNQDFIKENYVMFTAYHAVLGSRYHAQSQTSTVFLQPGQHPVTPPSEYWVFCVSGETKFVQFCIDNVCVTTNCKVRVRSIIRVFLF